MRMRAKFTATSLAAAMFIVLAGLILPATANADSPAETLEKGIYNEETTGDLNLAIVHYRQVLADAQKTKTLAAQAQYRLGRCLSKLGKTAEAEQAFEDLITDYPDQKELIAKARKLIASRPEMLSAPWKSGERLTLTMMLTNGRPIGIVGTSVTEGMLNGKPVWNMNVRRHIGIENSGVSNVVVDKTTNLPIKTHWDHTLLGKTDAKWQADSVAITSTKEGKTETKTVSFDKPCYDNDQWFYGFRQLPMKIGNKTTVPIRVTFTGGNELEMEIEVAAKEKIETPAGTFDCFRLDTNVQQTFWITDTPERYIAKFEAGGVQALLSSIGDDQPTKLSNDKLGFSITAPAGWFYFVPQTGNDTTSGAFNLVAPSSLVTAVVKVRKKSMLDSDERQSPQAWADSIVRSAKDFSKEAREVDQSRKEVELAGESGVSFEINSRVSGRSIIALPTVAFKGDKAVELTMSGDAEPFEAHRETLDRIRESVTVD